MAQENSAQRDLSVDSLSAAVRGDWAELTAALWLMERGYEVFKNLRTKGPIDLVAWKRGEVRLIDVKFVKMNFRRSTLHVSASEYIAAHPGIELLFVSSHGICGFSPAELLAKYQQISGITPMKRGVGRPHTARLRGYLRPQRDPIATRPSEPIAEPEYAPVHKEALGRELRKAIRTHRGGRDSR